MIPARLSMRNFLCYRDNVPPLDFTGIHVACLAGDNGHGKTAILDAITWALWGRSRARTDDELVHAGQTEAEVDFEFLVDDVRYRVVRQRRRAQRGRPGVSSLELFVRSPVRHADSASADGGEADGSWRPISGDTLRDTERRIEEIVHIDYDTFINSAFLMQGRADEFVRKTPSQRKEVLAAILDLDQYDVLSERARELAKEAEFRRRQVEVELQGIDQELSRRPALEQQSEETHQEMEVLEGAMSSQEELVESLRGAAEALARQKELLASAEQRQRQAQEELQRYSDDVARHEARIADHQATVTQAEDIRFGYQRLEEARARDAELTHLQATVNELRLQERDLQSKIDAARQNLAAEVSVLTSRMEQLAARAASLTALGQDEARLQEELAGLDDEEAKLAGMRIEEQQAASDLQSLTEARQRLYAEVADLVRKAEELPEVSGNCPLCGTGLGEGELHHIREHYREEETARRQALSESEERAGSLSRRADKLRQDISDLEAGIRHRRSELDQHLAIVRRQIEESEAAGTTLPGAQAEVAALQKRLDDGDYASDEQHRLIDTRGRMEALAYDPAAHDKARRAMEDLAQFEERFRHLEQAEVLLERELEALTVAQENRDRWQERSVEAKQEVERFAKELERQPDLTPQLAQERSKLEGMQRDERRLRQALGALEGELERLRALEQGRRPKVEALTQAASDKAIHDELAAAFGRNGVQALIIDGVLPEIADEANSLLSQMTGGRMQLAMTTQRETQKKAVVETLDIKVSDELGDTRSYEMFSGGEAFRINFALRIALSRLLARRAGAPLPTLIIDEGFGTQDSGGRERLVEAIQAIQDDFRCLLVITHVEELRDAFPVRIEVTKTPAGSTIAVV
jgi:exonuclease SbcC